MSQTIAQIGLKEALPGAQRQDARRSLPGTRARRRRSRCPSRKSAKAKYCFALRPAAFAEPTSRKSITAFLAPPQILGHELAGTVVKVGDGVTKFKPGDRVVSFHHIPCGACFYCEQKLFSQCAGYKKVGLTAGFDPNGGGFAEYVRAMPWIVERGMMLLARRRDF